MAPEPTPTQTPSKATPPGSGSTTTLKEVAATVLAGLITVAFLVAFAKTWDFIGGADPKLAEAKNLLQILTGFVGVILGYYFGRVPAERAADAATKAADASRSEAQDAKAREERTRKNAASGVQDALSRLGPTGPAGGGQPGAGAGTGPEAAALVLRGVLKGLE
jgi:hypothetical protein